MSNNPKCPKCQSRTNCEGFYVMEIIVYKCVGKGCHARIYQDHNGYYTREGNTRHNIEREEVK